MYSSTPKQQCSTQVVINKTMNGEKGLLDQRKVGQSDLVEHDSHFSYTLPKPQMHRDNDTETITDFSNNCSNRWLKHAKSSKTEERASPPLTEQAHGSFRWASMTEDDISERSICASSQMLQEHLILIDLESMSVNGVDTTTLGISSQLHQHTADSSIVEDGSQLVTTDSGLGDISITDDSMKHPSNGYTVAHKATHKVTHKATPPISTLLDCYADDPLQLTDYTLNHLTRPSMPYFPSDIIQRLSPIFNEHDSLENTTADSSPPQVAPLASHNAPDSTMPNHYMYYTDDANTSAEWNHEAGIIDTENDIILMTGNSETGQRAGNSETELRAGNSELKLEPCLDGLKVTTSPEPKIKESINKVDYYQLTNIDNEVSSDDNILTPNHCDDTGGQVHSPPYGICTDLSAQLPNTTSVLTIEQLPEELIFKILYYLTPHELCVSVAPISSKWRDYANHPILWQFIDLSPSQYRDMDTDDMCELLQRAYLLKSLSLRGWRNLNVSIIDLIGQHCTMLQEINLSFSDTLNDSIIKAMVQHCKLLTVVNVEGCESINDSSAFHFTSLPELRVLNMSHCTKITDEVLFHIAVLCQKLEALNIDGIPWISDNAIECLASERCTTLMAMFIDGAELTDKSIRSLIACQRLHTLSISFCDEFSDKSLTYLRKLNSLKHLRLKRGGEFTGPALADLFLSDNMASITYLNLTECSELCDRGVESITRVCKSLQHLALCWCWEISDVGLECIVDNCSQLEVLDLHGVKRIKGKCLVKVPKAMPYLTLLDLRDCNLIQDSMLVSLVSIKTNLSVLNYYGEEVTVCTCTDEEDNSDACENAANPLIDHY